MKNKVKKEFNYFSYLGKYKFQSFFAPFCKGIETLSDLWNLLKSECSINGTGGYSLQYIFPIIVNEFNLNVEVTYDNFNDKDQGFCNLTDDLIVSIIETNM